MLGCQAGNVDPMPHERINFEDNFYDKIVEKLRFLYNFDNIFFYFRRQCKYFQNLKNHQVLWNLKCSFIKGGNLYTKG